MLFLNLFAIDLDAINSRISVVREMSLVQHVALDSFVVLFYLHVYLHYYIVSIVCIKLKYVNQVSPNE